MWTLRAKHGRITIFLIAAPEDSLKTLKAQLQTALQDAQLYTANNENLRLRIGGIVQTQDEQTLREVGLEDGAVFEFSQQLQGEWEPFYIESYPSDSLDV
ncbi:hypothetical protein PORY_001417 [Pneumocystis oryctolagi]|uniref:Uncharacterized protein n=1 Tax=Pneumocystis oryctolagi TaxID=42067 RepID=A0ACB7CFG6_9ASCO|nr:hypothetical protein PORY_001417 [Pneumocystis oryctolagi]